jgi:hypothetical protein
MARFTVEPAREVTPGVFVIERVASSSFSLGMVLVRLPDGGLLVYSPTWLGADTWSRVEAVGRPSVLVAPNHFHHLSLGRYRERYPQASAVASRGALPRLRARGHEGLAALEQVESALPPGGAFLQPAGLKNGEAWLALSGGAGHGSEGGGGGSSAGDDRGGSTSAAASTTWIVGDAFFNMTRPVTGVPGFFMRRLGIVPGLRIGDPWRWLGVGDRAAYRAWVREKLAAAPPQRLVFAHGEPLAAADLGARLQSLVDARI